MKYQLSFVKGFFVTTESWLHPKNENNPIRVKANEELQRTLGLDKPVVTEVLSPEDAAALKQMHESQWAVYVEQGIPLRDLASLRWYAQVALNEVIRTNRTTTQVYWLAREKIQKAAGGTLPGYADVVLKEIEPIATKVSKTRADRNRKKIPPPSPPKREDKLAEQARAAVKGAVERAKFRHPRKAKGGFLDIRVQVFKSVGTRPWTAFISDYYQTGRKKGDRIELAVRTDWPRIVGKAGLANIFGPRTLVLHAEVIPNGGTKLVVVEQGETQYALKVSEGWLSRDKQGNPIFKTGGRS